MDSSLGPLLILLGLVCYWAHKNYWKPNLLVPQWLTRLPGSQPRGKSTRITYLDRWLRGVFVKWEDASHLPYSFQNSLSLSLWKLSVDPPPSIFVFGSFSRRFPSGFWFHRWFSVSKRSIGLVWVLGNFFGFLLKP